MTTIAEEKAFEAKAERMLAGHRQAPNGRNVFAFVMRNLNNGGYRGKFDSTFKESPSSSGWWEETFCNRCDKNKAWCECSNG